MKNINDLLQDALNVLEIYKGTVPPDKLKNDVLPLIYRIRDELATIKIDSFKLKTTKHTKEKNIVDFIDTPIDFIDTPIMKFEDEISTFSKTRPCKTDPRAPHGCLEELSKTMDRYVCKCEFWDPILK